MEKDPIQQFVDATEKLMVAVVGREMSRHGMISKYPENFTPDVDAAKKEMYDFMTSQDPNEPVAVPVKE